MVTQRLVPPTLDLVLYDKDGHAVELENVNELGVAQDVSAYTWTSQWRKTRKATDATAINLSVDVSQAAVGIVTVHFSAATLAQIAGRAGQWDVQGAIGAADPTSIVSGKVTIDPDVTRPGSP